ncbi:Alpha/Beta hydrolase protein, partial [Baffinella frigidus]
MQSFSQNLKKTSIINRFLFPAPHSSYTWSSFEGELLAIVGRTGNIVPCTVMPGMCARQGEDVGLLNEAGHWLCDTLGVHVMLPEYPGYGVAPGVPNEVSINENIRACYDFAVHGLNWDPLKVLLFGRSIGTGPAIQLASELPVGGLILVSPYSSIKELVSQHVGLLSAFLMVEMADIFPSDQRIKQVKCPTLIVHGATDLVIDCAQAKKLYLNSGGEPKRLVVLDGVGHHGIDLHFAVVHEFARIFQDDFEPRYLNIDGFLADPAVQGDTVASPVPVFDCRSMNWSRPTLVRGSTPFLRTPPAGSLAAHASYVAPPPQ